MLAYLTFLAFLLVLLLIWWRLLSRFWRGVVIAIIFLHTFCFFPGPILGPLTPRYILAVMFNQPFLMDKSQGMYANGYTHSRFRRAKVGMTRQQVTAILGQPIIHSPAQGGGREVFVYAMDSDDSYYIRAFLYFDKQGSVAEKIWTVEVD